MTVFFLPEGRTLRGWGAGGEVKKFLRVWVSREV